MTLRPLARSLLVALGALLCVGATAQTPPLAPEDSRLVYEELVSTHDGEIYMLNIVGFATEQEAAKAWDDMNRPPAIGLRLDKAFKGITPRPRYLFAIEPALRERVVKLHYGERTGPVKTRRGFAIAELVETRAVPAPAFKEVESALPGLVASGALPSAEQLRTDPVFVARRELNAVTSVEALARARSDLDLNALRSAHFTPLLHALYLGRPDFVEALLRRGADPNYCAHANCPLRLAVMLGADAAVEALLKSGADPDGIAPDAGVVESPLVAAAGRGNLALARRLLAAGAHVDGHGRGRTPLMAAAARADRSLAELLLAKGADPSASRTGIPPLLRIPRNAIDQADGSGNPDFAAWLRDVARERARTSGAYAWTGFVEQDGLRQPMDGRPVTLKRAPFRLVFRMAAGRELYVTASTDAAAYARFREPAVEPAGFHSRAAISAEDDKNLKLVVHAPQAAPQLWGGSQLWWAGDGETRFSATVDTPQGREFVREVGELVLIDANDKISDVSFADYPGSSIYLIAGTRVRLGWLDDDVFEPRFVELRFR